MNECGTSNIWISLNMVLFFIMIDPYWIYSTNEWYFWFELSGKTFCPHHMAMREKLPIRRSCQTQREAALMTVFPLCVRHVLSSVWLNSDSKIMMILQQECLVSVFLSWSVNTVGEGILTAYRLHCVLPKLSFSTFKVYKSLVRLMDGIGVRLL